MVIHNIKKNEIVDFGYDSDYGYNSDSDYENNEFQSDLPIEDLRSVDSPTEEHNFPFRMIMTSHKPQKVTFPVIFFNKEITIT